MSEEACDDYMKNFGMLIPKDIERWPDGSPKITVRQEEKIAFIVWLSNKDIDASALEGQELETFFKLWKKYWSNG